MKTFDESPQTIKRTLLMPEFAVARFLVASFHIEGRYWHLVLLRTYTHKLKHTHALTNTPTHTWTYL